MNILQQICQENCLEKQKSFTAIALSDSPRKLIRGSETNMFLRNSIG